jgi:uncharacterized surface protein with fasciclin (FAS1) repeats
MQLEETMHSITKLTLTALWLAAVPVVVAAQDSTKRDMPARDTLTTGALTLPSETSAPTAATRSVLATATAAGSFNTFVAAVKTAGLTETLEGKGPFTIFAPTDAAFAKLPKAQLDALLKDQAKLKAILTYHVLPGNFTSDQLVKLTSAKTLNGKTLKIVSKDGKLWVDNGQVTLTDMPATNGSVYAIDTVLLPN